MANLTFPITDKMIMTCREYSRLKTKHLNTKGMKVGDSDNYIKNLTSNAFKMLKRRYPQNISQPIKLEENPLITRNGVGLWILLRTGINIGN